VKPQSIVAAALLAVATLAQGHELPTPGAPLIHASAHPSTEHRSSRSLYSPTPYACEQATWTYQAQSLAAQQHARQDRAYLRQLIRAEASTAATLKLLARNGYLDPVLRTRMDAIYKEMREVYGYDLVPVEGFRSPERQAQLLDSGTGITTVGAMGSCHQYGLALDSVLMRGGVPQWDMTDPWTRRGYFLFGELATRDGLEWGGHWTVPKDFAHVELKSECYAAKRSAGSYFAAIARRMGRERFQ
jgi:hypothetical protein